MYAGEMSRETLFELFPREAEEAERSVLCRDMSSSIRDRLNAKLQERLGNETRWVLVGGPLSGLFSYRSIKEKG